MCVPATVHGQLLRRRGIHHQDVSAGGLGEGCEAHCEVGACRDPSSTR